MTKNRDSKRPPEHEPQTEDEKRPYVKPELKVWGAVTDITRGAGSGIDDGVGQDGTGPV